MHRTKTNIPGTAETMLGQIAEEYFDQLARGEKPNVEDYAQQYSEFADHIREIFPALDLIKDSTGSATQSLSTGIEATELNRLGDYQILGELGRGGMGVVYEAHQISLNRRVALKVLPFAAVMDSRQLARFKNEALAAASLDHPNIVDVFTVGCERSVHFYAMRYITGQSVAELIVALRQLSREDAREIDANPRASSQLARDLSHGPIGTMAASPPTRLKRTIDSAPNGSPVAGSSSDTVPQLEAAISTQRSVSSRVNFYRNVASLGVQAASALDHAHAQGILHRDIKPGNLMVDTDGKLWVTDFGLARIESEVGMTMTGDLLGTLRYMSPEQALAKRVVVDQRADIYSLGVTLYELLSLQPAFTAADRQELLKQIAFDEPRRLRQIERRIPADLETIVGKAIEKNPADRYATAQEMAEDLQRFLDDQAILARRSSLVGRVAKWSRRNRAFVAAGLVGMIISLIGLLVTTLVTLRQQRMTEHARQEATQSFQGAAVALENVVRRIAEEDLAASPQLEKLRQDILDEGVAYYRELTRRESRLPGMRKEVALAHSRLGDIFSELGNHQEAYREQTQGVQLLRRLIDDYPENIEYQLELARKLIAQSQAAFGTHMEKDAIPREEGQRCLAEATQLLEEIQGKYPDRPGVRYALAIAYRGHGKWITSRNQPQQPTPEDYAAARPLCLQGQALAERLLQENPDNDDYRDILANLLLDLAETNYQDATSSQREGEETVNNLRRAVKLARAAVTSSPQSAKYRNTLTSSLSLLSNLLSERGRFHEASALRREWKELAVAAVQRRPLSPSAKCGLAMAGMHLANSLAQEKRLHDAAREVYDAAAVMQGVCREFPEDLGHRNRLSWILGNLTVICSMQGQRSTIIEAWRRSLTFEQQVCRDFPDAGNELDVAVSQAILANYLVDGGDDQEAWQLFCEARQRFAEEFERQPDHAWLLSTWIWASYNACEVWWTAGNKERSREAADEFLRLGEKLSQVANPHDAKPYYAWAIANLPQDELRDVNSALQLAQEVLEEDPDNQLARRAVGAAHYRLGNWKASIQAFQKVFESQEDEWQKTVAKDAFFLAMSHRQLEDHSQARKWFEIAMQAMAERDILDVVDDGPSHDLLRFQKEAADLLEISLDDPESRGQNKNVEIE